MGEDTTSRMVSCSRPIVDLGLRHAPEKTDIVTSLTGKKTPSVGSPEGIDGLSVQFDVGCQSIQYLQPHELHPGSELVPLSRTHHIKWCRLSDNPSSR